MSEHVAVDVTSADQLLQFETIRLKSARGDYLHRPDSPSGVTTWPVGELRWWVERAASGRFRLKSWKGDYLHRPDGPPGVTTWPAGELEWAVEVAGGAIRLKSWKGDYLCRADAVSGVTTADAGAIDWSVEGQRSAADIAAWQRWVDVIMRDKEVAAAGIYGLQNGMCLAASPGLAITAAEARALASELIQHGS